VKWPKRIVVSALSGWDDAQAWKGKAPRGRALYELVLKPKKANDKKRKTPSKSESDAARKRRRELDWFRRNA